MEILTKQEEYGFECYDIINIIMVNKNGLMVGDVLMAAARTPVVGQFFLWNITTTAVVIRMLDI